MEDSFFLSNSSAKTHHSFIKLKDWLQCQVRTQASNSIIALVKRLIRYAICKIYMALFEECRPISIGLFPSKIFYANFELSIAFPALVPGKASKAKRKKSSIAFRYPSVYKNS